MILNSRFQRMTWREAMDRFGSDKPDLRFGMELKNVSDVVKNCEFVVFKGALEQGGSVRGINAEGQGAMPRKKIDALVEFAKGFGAKGLAYLAINEDGTYKSSFAKFMTEDELKALVEAMDGKPGDLLLFAADKDKVVFDVLGNLRLELAKQLGLLKKDDFKFLWVTEFPLFEYSEEQDRYVAMHHPVHHAHGRGSAPYRHRSWRGAREGLRYRVERYGDGRRFRPYPSGGYPGEDV